MVVDDDEAVRAILAEALQDRGYLVVQAADGEEGIRLIEADPFLRILIADVHMPGMSGLELAELARHARPDLKVILISGFLLPRPVPYTLLRKPFHTRELVAAVSAALS